MITISLSEPGLRLVYQFNDNVIESHYDFQMNSPYDNYLKDLQNLCIFQLDSY